MSGDDNGRTIECEVKSLDQRVAETLRLVGTARTRLREALTAARDELAAKVRSLESLQGHASTLHEQLASNRERINQIQAKIAKSSRELEELRKEAESLEFKAREIAPTIRLAEGGRDAAADLVTELEGRIESLDESEPMLSALLRDRDRAQEARDRATEELERAAYESLLRDIDFRAKGILARITSDAHRPVRPHTEVRTGRARTKNCRCQGMNPSCTFCCGRGFV